MPLVECIPNFSEGRDATVIGAIRAAIASAPVKVLDVSSDPDHNRTVITFAGEPDDVTEAMLRGAREAVTRINLQVHIGVHPRIGAVDVIPFVPLRDISLTECAQLARSFGRRLVETLDLPVYLYEAAALRPERTNLAHVRRGGYEALLLEIDQPHRRPDFGAPRLGTAGAVAVGARPPLIAFNAYLDTDDVVIAQRIAAAIRGSGGGLPYLKALGLLVGGRAQVSMNITDFRKTSLYAIMGRLHAEAVLYGVQVVETELIGLIPQAALIAYAVESLHLPANAADFILERRLGAAFGDYREVLFE